MSLASPRAAVVAAFIALGASIGLWSGSIPAVVMAAGLSKQDLGLGLSAMTLAYVLAMSAGSRLSALASNRTILLAMLPFQALAMAGLKLRQRQVEQAVLVLEHRPPVLLVGLPVPVGDAQGRSGATAERQSTPAAFGLCAAGLAGAVVLAVLLAQQARRQPALTAKT